MSYTVVVESLERELQIWGVSFSLADLLEFVSSSWSLIEDDPDMRRWAGKFIEATPAQTQ